MTHDSARFNPPESERYGRISPNIGRNTPLMAINHVYAPDQTDRTHAISNRVNPVLLGFQADTAALALRRGE